MSLLVCQKSFPKKLKVIFRLPVGQLNCCAHAVRKVWGSIPGSVKSDLDFGIMTGDTLWHNEGSIMKI